MNDRFNNSPAGLVEFDRSGVITYINTTLAMLLGAPVEELQGAKFESLLTVANKIFFQTHLLPLLELNRTASEVFLILRARNGTSLPMIAAAAKENGVTQCVFLTFSERHKYEREILQARHAAEAALESNAELKAAKEDSEHKVQDLDRRLQQLAGRNQELTHLAHILSHDLREPMRKVRIFADILRETTLGSLDEDGTDALRKILQESDRAVELIASVRRLMDSGNTREPARQIDLNAIIDLAARSARETYNDWDLHAEKLPSIEGRFRQVKIMFKELLDNAIKFRTRDVRLAIAIRGRLIQQNAFNVTKGKYAYRPFLQIEVADNGTGIPIEFQEYVFEPLKKVIVRSDGIGIGLSICRKIAESHFGSIEVVPQSTEGTTIVIRLPVVSEVSPQRREDSANPLGPGSSAASAPENWSAA